MVAVLDRFDAELSESCDVVFHGLQLFWGVSLPLRDLAGEAWNGIVTEALAK